jgi:ubiquinol-cytochrome c reductase cytochrome c1 subunit
MPNVLWELQGLQTAKFEPKETSTEHGKSEQHCKHGQQDIDGRCFAGFTTQPGKLSTKEFDEAARDLTTFLQYVGEPAALQREKIGLWVVLYLGLFTFLAWLVKKEYWKDLH